MATRKKTAARSAEATKRAIQKGDSNGCTSSAVPPDQVQREAVVSALDTTMLVEASAGSGKTRSMVDRMIALVREGKCDMKTLAAITFTRKAAAELRGRFQISLERAAREASGPARQRLEQATHYIDQAFIGTIHSFCSRLLRERPVEAGVDPSFSELDDTADASLREEAWTHYIESLSTSNDPLLKELSELGLAVGELKRSFLDYAKYPDVEQWPAESVELSDTEAACVELAAYVERMEGLLDTFPHDTGRDQLMPKYSRISRVARQSDLKNRRQLMELLSEFEPLDRKKLVQKNWPGGKDQALQELERWNRFAENHAMPLVSLWRQARYAVIVRVFFGATLVYDRLRAEIGGLSYQDLLLLAARLLRGQRHIREYFRRRFTHLLVDEFQDTDPVQAEVMLLLTADDPGEINWRRAKPVPGSLFVVGDPKQSIYRFRRADIVTYNEVKQIITHHGEVIQLTANFRSQKPLIEWVNHTCHQLFPDSADDYSPERAPMDTVHGGAPRDSAAAVEVLRSPSACGNNESIVAFESRAIAEVIHDCLSNSSNGKAAKPSDFLIISQRKAHLGNYARELAKRGIPCEVTGGAVLSDVRELELLCLCLEAVTEPDNPVALVAVLRSELFGCSDELLYAFKKSGGWFAFQSRIDAEMPEEVRSPLADIFDRLKRYASWLKRLPPAAAMERIATDLGLLAHAALGPGGNERAGSVARAVELVRAAAPTLSSITDVVAYLRKIVDGEENHDGFPAVTPDQPPVRIMNLHQAKGLEAQVVFLADPTGKMNHDPTLHINRRENQVEGYLSILHKPNNRSSNLLAHPRDWEHYSAEERRFQDAEKNRLLYVATTRPGRRLVISQREKRNNLNPWNTLAPHLEDCPTMEVPEAREIPDASRRTLEPTQPASIAQQVSGRWAAVQEPSYCLQTAKSISVAPSGLAPSGGEHGTEWGSVIHALLETCMRNPAADLGQLADAGLNEHGLDPMLRDKAIETVRSVTQSDLWKRAQASSKVLVEVPFQMQVPVDSSAEALLTILRGVIDLVFHEKDGWAVIDYKTDVRSETELSQLIEHYRGQVETYATLWQQTTGEPVTERGLYFTHTARYVVL